MAIDERVWQQARRMVRLGSPGPASYAIETTRPNGSFATFEIDSVLLDRRVGLGVYFVTFGTADLSRALDSYPQMRLTAAVTRGRLGRLTPTRFGAPSGIVLAGVPGRRRAATPAEAAKWRQYAVGRTINGHEVRPEPNLYVRELRFRSASIHLDEALDVEPEVGLPGTRHRLVLAELGGFRRT